MVCGHLRQPGAPASPFQCPCANSTGMRHRAPSETPQAADNAVFRSLRDYARTSPIGMADPKRYAEVKGAMSN